MPISVLALNVIQVISSFVPYFGMYWIFFTDLEGSNSEDPWPLKTKTKKPITLGNQLIRSHLISRYTPKNFLYL